MSSNPWMFAFHECRTYTFTFTPGVYKLEVWGAAGAQGGSSGGYGGDGGYSKGELTVNENMVGYIHLGGKGKCDGSSACNGGGYGSGSTHCGGGGGSDIRLVGDTLYHRVIVAGGGGGGANGGWESGGDGGGLNGLDANDCGNNGGRGAGQDGNTVGCTLKTNTKCNTGYFGSGGPGYSSAGGGGGGWYGGSSGYNSEAGGGGSGYVLTSSSYKPYGYELTNSKYFLKNTQSVDGNSVMPSPTSSGGQYGNWDDGFARITLLSSITPTCPTLPQTPRPTRSATPGPSMIRIGPEHKFVFTSLNGDVIKDRLGIFEFYSQNNYTSNVKPGLYSFYANGSSCGQSVYVQYRIDSPSTMQVSISKGITVSINHESFLMVPGYTSSFGTFIDPKASTLSNYSMSSYACQNAGASLLISYTPNGFGTCQRKLNFKPILFIFFSLFLH
jgi:hypothetical protein